MNNVYTPISFPKFKLCDIAFNSKKYIIIAEQHHTIPLLDIWLITNDGKHPFKSFVDPEGMVVTYECEFPTRMDQIDLSINGNIYTFNVNIFPSFETQTIFSTLVWDEDEYIVQWIEFHKRLGISRFVIYDNVPTGSSTLVKTLYPFLQQNEVILIRWPYKWGRPNGEAAQQTHQNHSIRVFEGAKWIGLFDVDEYINIREGVLSIPENLDGILNKMNMRYEEISSVRLNSRIFVSSKNESEDGFDFLKINTCYDFTTNARWKHFVNPKNTRIFSVHQVTCGLKSCYPSTDAIYFNHYMFLNRRTPTTGNYTHGKNTQYRDVKWTHTDTSIQDIASALRIF